MIENLWVMNQEIQNRDMDYDSFRFWVTYLIQEDRLDLVCDLVEQYPEHMERELFSVLEETGIEADKVMEPQSLEIIEKRIAQYLMKRFGIDL